MADRRGAHDRPKPLSEPLAELIKVLAAVAVDEYLDEVEAEAVHMNRSKLPTKDDAS